MNSSDRSFFPSPSTAGTPDFPALEERILTYWDDQKILEKTLSERQGKPAFVFFDGPPGTNGRPHIGHMMQSALKDLWPRYKTMRGFRVIRKAGWDTHGLPVELQAEKELGLKNKKDIEAYGVAKYVDYCRSIVFTYKDEWKKQIRRIGRFLDTENDYATLTNDFIQSDWWILRQAWEKNLLYRDYKIVPHCARCGTSLSSHEVAQGYKDVTEAAITVRFHLRDDANASLLVWTTTPWTLLSNVAVAVGPDIRYVRIRITEAGEGTRIGEEVILAESRLSIIQGSYDIVSTMMGKELEGLEYEPLFTHHQPREKYAYVVADKYVTDTDGTGLVHLALYGEDDFRIIREKNFPKVQLVDMHGHVSTEVAPWAGKFFKDVDSDVVADLEKRNQLFASDPHAHSYPFCWRCETPLMYYAKTSWFLRTTAYKDQMIAANDKIHWQPAHIKEGRFGRWLENNVDWAISRERFWGTPLPIWTCSGCERRECISSLADMTARLKPGATWDPAQSLHKPEIDTVILRCEHCAADMRREPDVLDCWFDAGAMPWGQWGYPATPGSEAILSDQYPADFIAEAHDQTRGWFYTLLAISTMLTGTSSFKNVICTELVLDAKGQKMSKSKGNVIEPKEMFDRFGADAVRWNFYNIDPWLPKRFGEETLSEITRRVHIPLWNVLGFMHTWSTEVGVTITPEEGVGNPTHVLDRWILSHLRALTSTVTTHLDDYDVAPAAVGIEQFIEHLSTWYVRRSRDRIKEGGPEAEAALRTLHGVLYELSKILAPFMPFFAEALYAALGGPKDSVHLEMWPVVDAAQIDTQLNEDMDVVFIAANLGNAIRKKEAMKVRQPLARMSIVSRPLADAYLDLLRDELNVKEVVTVSDVSSIAHEQWVLNFPAAGPVYGSRIPEIQHALKAGRVTREGERIRLMDLDLVLPPEHFETRYQSNDAAAVMGEHGVVVALDLALTPALEAEGVVRDLIRLYQDLRKDAGLHVSDRVMLLITANERLMTMVHAFEDMLMQKTGATELLSMSIEDRIAADRESEVTLDGDVIWIGVKKKAPTS